ncbi:hypothetical protein ACFL1J_03685 [Pseudomonadota bacterium]
MLALVTIFLVTLLASAMAVWVYRKISGWEGLGDISVARTPQRGGKRKMGLQQGFVSLVSAPKEQARNKRLRSPNGGIKAPWGW